MSVPTVDIDVFLLFVADQPFDWQRFLIYLGVFSLAFAKFALGVVAALAKGFSFWETQLTAGLGAVAGSWVFSYFGHEIRMWIERRFNLNKRPGPPKNTRLKRIWYRYGLGGVVALAPIISPQASIGIAVSFKEKPRRIAIYMTISVIVWTVLMALLKETVLGIAGK